MPPVESDLKAAYKVLKLEDESNTAFLASWRELPDADKRELGEMARQHIASLES